MWRDNGRMAITLAHHPGTLNRADLSNLATIAGRMANEHPRFAAWLLAVADHESNRRQVAGSTDTPTEPAMPVLDCSGWTTRELAKTAVAAFIAYEASSCDRLTPGSVRLLRSVHLTVLAWLQARIDHEFKDSN